MKDRFSLWRSRTPENAKKWPEGTLVCCDALDFLMSIRDEIADIVFIDPPVNLGKKYGSRGGKDDLKTVKMWDVVEFVE